MLTFLIQSPRYSDHSYNDLNCKVPLYYNRLFQFDRICLFLTKLYTTELVTGQQLVNPKT